MKHITLTGLSILLLVAALISVPVAYALANPPQPTVTHNISTKGDTHNPQALTVNYQDADNIVTTTSPQVQGDMSDQLQPAVAPIQ